VNLPPWQADSQFPTAPPPETAFTQRLSDDDDTAPRPVLPRPSSSAAASDFGAASTHVSESADPAAASLSFTPGGQWWNELAGGIREHVRRSQSVARLVWGPPPQHMPGMDAGGLPTLKRHQQVRKHSPLIDVQSARNISESACLQRAKHSATRIAVVATHEGRQEHCAARGKDFQCLLDGVEGVSSR
jgi:hypothetical protein